MEFLRPAIHYFLHLGFPILIAFIFFNKPKGRWKIAGLLLLLTMAIDLDHLFANPIFDPCRCSIGYHFLHSYIAIFFYALLLFFRPLRIPAIGLLMHIATDILDCALMRILQ